MGAAENWILVADTFTQAIDLDPAERFALLDSTFPASSPLRQQVERLLAAHDSAGDFLDVLDRDRSAALIAVTSADEPTPEMIGRYPVIREIGSGGMGVVYLAHDPALDRRVAVKLLRRTPGARIRGRNRLLEEARAASALDHPNVATVHEVGETEDGRAFIAMTFCEGESLAARLQRGRLSAREAAQIGSQVADALAAAHALDIVHRDVKPANVVVSAGGRARLMDFGVAVVGESAGLAAPAGTLAYMSPEQRRGEVAEPSSDVWSLGLLLTEMLSCQRIAPGTETLRVDSLDEIRVPKRLRRLVNDCMSPAAAHRPAAAAAAAELRAFLRAEESSWRMPRLFVSVALVVALLAAGWVLLRPLAATSADPTTLVMMPFVAPAQDTSLQRLARELVVTLSSAFDGMAGIRVTDPLAIPGSGQLQAGNDAAALRRARRLGAGIVVFGQLSHTETGVRALATVHDANSGRVLGDMSTESDGDITALTDSVILALWRSRWAESVVPATGTAARATSSVPAMRAFLEGEQAIANGRFRLAPESFARALEADPAFWFAAWRYWFSRAYHGSPVDSTIVAVVTTNRARLPDPDRMLLDARLASGARARLDRLRATTERHPTHWLAWFELGDHLTHHGAFLGIPLDEARTALRRSVELNPRLVPAWEHLFWTAILTRDTVESGTVLGQLETLRMDTLARLEWDLQPLDYYGYLDHLARTEGTPRAADANIGARVLSGTPGAAGPDRTSSTLLVYGFHRAQLDLSQRVITSDPPSRVASAHTWSSALAWAGRGDWDAAFAAARQYARAPSNERGAVWAYGLAVTGAWLGRIAPDTAATLRDDAQRSDFVRSSSAGRAELAWLDGLLACARGDDDALARQHAVLARSNAGSAAALARSLAAFESARSGRRPEAARALADIESQNADAGWHFTYGALHPFASAINRIAAGHWFFRTGETAAAAALLLLHETDLPSTLHPLDPVHMTLSSFSLAALADIEDARGRHDVARHYRAMLRERADLAPAPDSTPALCAL